MQRQYNTQIRRADKCHQRDAGSSCVRIGLLFGSLVIALGLVLIPGFINNYNTGLIDTQVPDTPNSAIGGHPAPDHNPVVKNGVVSTFGKHENM